MPLPLKVRFSSIVTLSLRTTFPLIAPLPLVKLTLSKFVSPLKSLSMAVSVPFTVTLSENVLAPLAVIEVVDI